MANSISNEELEKAARNLERLAHFMGERREWILASDAEVPALKTRAAAEALTNLLGEWTSDGGSNSEVAPSRHPPNLEPSGKVSAGRLEKFSEFLDQLSGWFASHDATSLPKDSAQLVRSIRASLSATSSALTQMLGVAAMNTDGDQSEGLDADDDPTDFGPLTAEDLGPVAEVDVNARLILHDTVKKRLLQEFRGVKELTTETRELVDDFFKNQNVEYSDHEMRKIYDKVQKWIEGTPEGRALVVKISGLSGKPQPYSSYRMVEDIEELQSGKN